MRTFFKIYFNSYNDQKKLYTWKLSRLVMELKNCCLKRCENYSLKSVVEIHVFSVYKTKKCVWYHSLNNMFQCSKNIKMCLVCVFDLKNK